MLWLRFYTLKTCYHCSFSNTIIIFKLKLKYYVHWICPLLPKTSSQKSQIKINKSEQKLKGNFFRSFNRVPIKRARARLDRYCWRAKFKLHGLRSRLAVPRNVVNRDSGQSRLRPANAWRGCSVTLQITVLTAPYLQFIIAIVLFANFAAVKSFANSASGRFNSSIYE